MNARDRLSQLVDLATGSAPEDRTMLANELADVLAAWPEDYPAHMRASFALLLEDIVAQLDKPARRDFAARFAADPHASPSLLADLYVDAGADMRDAILSHLLESADVPAHVPEPLEETRLIHSVRNDLSDEFVRTASAMLSVSTFALQRILADASGESLAMLCKGTGLSRASYSTITVLSEPSVACARRRLDSFDAVPQEIARRMTHFWQSRQRERTPQARPR